MNIDDRLREILTLELPNGATYELLDTPNTIEQIKQAFKEAGYRTLDKDTKSIYAPTISDEYRTFMTGQEWYERFTDEYLNIKAAQTNTATILAAAKRAAGIQETDND